MRVHHYHANRTKWNQDDRFKPMPLKAPCTIWYVGANTHGGDGLVFYKKYKCKLHLFEPMPSFFKQLKSHWKSIPNAVLHPYGLGKYSRVINNVQEKGVSTFTMSEGTGKVSTEIKHPSAVKGFNETIDLLHVNCEGCEWELLEAFIASGKIPGISIVQFGTHWFQQVPDIGHRYCSIDATLQKTHRKIFQQPFGWERWQVISKTSINSCCFREKMISITWARGLPFFFCGNFESK